MDRAAHAISRGPTATVVAYQILIRRLVLDQDDWHETGGNNHGRLT